MKLGEKLLELINLNNELIQLNRNKIKDLAECVELQQEQINMLADMACKKPEFKSGGKKITISKDQFLELVASITADRIETLTDKDDLEFTAHIPVIGSLLATKLFDEKKEEKDEQES